MSIVSEHSFAWWLNVKSVHMCGMLPYGARAIIPDMCIVYVLYGSLLGVLA